MPFLNEMPAAWAIYNQLGGNQFATMVGAKDHVASDDGLRFRFGRNASKSSRCEIRVDGGSDTYTVLFYHLLKGHLVIDESFEFVYADGLREVFERHTGMATHL